ncbi:MAG: 1-acyl-sn-glycerol-3-phosphate acyltransferase [Thermoanaerobaculia bacterium]|nr:1-acyl-sn-glycerol-3-phosphate acyltransferase [Thermoanaerobaculia bacterium]
MSSLASTFADRWLRRGIITSLGLGFTIPYFRLLNRVKVTGDSIVDKLPRKNVVFLSNHQTYFMEAMAIFDIVYVKHHLPLENPFLRFSAATETMKKNPLTQLFTKAGGVTFRRSFREGGKDVKRGADFEGIAKVEEAIANGWLLHFPAGTTQKDAPLRPGVAQLLHRTKAVAVPVRVDGFRKLLLYKQFPGKILKKCDVALHPPLDLTKFYAAPYHKDAGVEIVERLSAILSDPD